MKNHLQTGCLVLGILCLLYYTAIVAYAGITADFAWIWAVGGLVLLALRKGLMYQSVHPKSPVRFVTGGIIGLLAVGVAVVFVIGFSIVKAMLSSPETNLDYVVVLGAQVKGSVPSRALRKRLDCAVDYAKENPDTIFILSGGQGPGEDITEAECMYRYMTDKGISKDRLILEDRSTSTWENLRFSAELAPIRDKRAGVLSNNFHIYRAARIARSAGYRHISGIPAHSDIGMQPHYILREVFAVVVGAVRGQIG